MRFPKLNLAIAVSLIASGTAAAGQETTPTSTTTPPGTAAQTLDDLIPQSAVDDAESWAADGSASEGPPDPPEQPQSEPVEDAAGQTGDLDPGMATPAILDVEAAFEQIGSAEPDPLEPDPDRPTFADIAAPNLVELPKLAEYPLTDALTLGFPAEQGVFPEQADFITRFRALSAITALDSGAETVPQLAARARADAELLAQMLRTYGYYSGDVVRQLSGGRRDFDDEQRAETQDTAAQEPKVRFDIIPGARFRFGKIDLGELESLAGADGDDLRAAFAIAPGDPLYADRIITQQAMLQVTLGESGYPFAMLGEPALLIDHAREEGDLTLPVQPGGKYQFGGVVSSDPEFLSDRHLQRIARFAPGDTYRTSLQSDLRRAILATGLVSSVAITPRAAASPADGQPGKVALEVEMERAPLRTISGAIGYGTEDGFKLEAGWEHRNLFPPEGALQLRGIIGTREQLASITFRRNNFRARDQVLSVDAYASDIETEAVDARTIALRGSFERVSNLLFQKPLSWQVGAEVLYSDERNRVINGIVRPRQTYMIAGLFSSATIDSSDDLLDPSSGYRLTGFLAPEFSHSLGRHSFYLRAQADASYYHDAGRAVIAGRVRAATIQGAEAFAIAPSRRLYSGGGGSVRGYGFQGIGPRNDLGEATGGGSLVEVALEARIQTGILDGAVELVPFFDAGTVALGSTPDFRFIQYGAGVGVRYKTSFGPIRVDVGVPLNPGQFDAPVVVYVSLGQAF